jgi:large subunit ribosomal protein L21
MFAVVRTGGKQYRVTPGDVIDVEKLDGNVGDSITLGEVLATGGDKPQIGLPLIKDASVTAEILEQGRGDKVIIFKKKRRHTYRRKAGHRQHLTTLRITEIPGAKWEGKKAASKPKAEKKADKAETTEKAPAKKPATKKAAKASDKE